MRYGEPEGSRGRIQSDPCQIASHRDIGLSVKAPDGDAGQAHLRPTGVMFAIEILSDQTATAFSRVLTRSPGFQSCCERTNPTVCRVIQSAEGEEIR